MTVISSAEQLRGLYREAKGRPLLKELSSLEKHCRHFISLSRFVVISTSSADGKQDASPRGGEPGFVKVVDDKTIIIPDWPGNNRLDSITNIIETGRIGLIFVIAGVNETLRINGTAQLRTDDSLVSLCPEKNKIPKLVIHVTVDEAYLHCAKSLMRSKLWDANEQIPRDALPTMSRMINDQINSNLPEETQEEMETRYREQLY